MKELIEAGLFTDEMKDDYTLTELIEAGMDAANLKRLGFDDVVAKKRAAGSRGSFVVITTNTELKDAVRAEAPASPGAAPGADTDIENWDVSLLDDFMYAFHEINGLTTGGEGWGLSKWNVAQGTNFYGMFVQYHGSLNMDLSKWDVAKGTDFTAMVRIARPRGGVAS